MKNIKIPKVINFKPVAHKIIDKIILGNDSRYRQFKDDKFNPLEIDLSPNDEVFGGNN